MEIQEVCSYIQSRERERERYNLDLNDELQLGSEYQTSLVFKRRKFSDHQMVHYSYRKDTEPLYHAFMYSPIILLSSIYPFTQCLSLLVTII